MSSTERDTLAFRKPFSPTLSITPSYELQPRGDEVFVTIDESEEDIKKFLERTHLLTEPNEYPRNHEEPGLVLIFNQERCSGKKPRHGSRRDVNEIVLCFSRLGFNITKNNIYTDYTKNEIIEVIDEITSAHLSKNQVNSLIVFFLTHGDTFNVLDTCDSTMYADEMWKKFSECEYLKNKPKMFIIQACKGSEHSGISANPRINSTDIVPYNTFSTNFIGQDMIIVCSATEGNVSFRNTTTGSWFIQELCKNFSAYGRRDDVISLIIRTTKCICRNYYNVEKNLIQKQMPMFISTLTKKFYLNRSKERNLLIDVQNKYEAVCKDVDELKTKVDVLYKNYEEQKKKQRK